MHLIKYVKEGGEVPSQLPANIIPQKFAKALSRSASSASFNTDRRTSLSESWVVDSRSFETSKANFFKNNPNNETRVAGNILAKYFVSLCPNTNALKVLIAL